MQLENTVAGRNPKQPLGMVLKPGNSWDKLGARLIGVRDVLGASVLLRNILKSKYYWEVGSIDKYVFGVVFTLGRMMTHCNYYGFYYKNAAFQSPETIVEMMLSSSSSSLRSTLNTSYIRFGHVLKYVPKQSIA